MKKSEYLAELKSELKRNNAADMDDIILEYEQHFAFKMADGYSEEEIAAKLGTPKTIAAQFESTKKIGDGQTGGHFFLKLGLGFTALFEAIFYILFLAWDIVLGASTVCLGALGAYLIGYFEYLRYFPRMPYFGSLILGISVLGLGIVFAVATIYCFTFLKQMIKASLRWHKNTLGAALPPLPWSPQFEPKTRRNLRTVLLWAVAVFGGCFVLSFVVLVFSAGTLGFWHHWNWFVP